MAKKPRTDVVLTKEGREILNQEAIRLFLKDGTHFNCKSTEQNGSFLHMKVRDPTSKKELVFDCAIPVHFVLYLVSAAARERLGFE